MPNSSKQFSSYLPDLIVVYGPVGSGQGTQAHQIGQQFKYYQFGFGTELRRFVAEHQHQPSPHQALASKIQQIMLQGANVDIQDLFFVAEDKFRNLLDSNQRIVIDSLKTLESVTWLANLTKQRGMSCLLIHLEVSLQTSLERLAHRYYLPNNLDLPYPSYQTALEACPPGVEPIRRQDDNNLQRISNQYNSYLKNKDFVIKTLTQNGDFAYLPANSEKNIDQVFTQISQGIQDFSRQLKQKQHQAARA